MILNVLNNYILYETVICYKDRSWFKSRIKSLIGNKNKLRKNYRIFKCNSHLLSKLNLLQKQRLLINRSKQNYFARTVSKLANVREILRHIGPIKPIFKQ